MNENELRRRRDIRQMSPQTSINEIQQQALVNRLQDKASKKSIYLSVFQHVTAIVFRPEQHEYALCIVPQLMMWLHVQ